MSLFRAVQGAIFVALAVLLLSFYWHIELAKWLPIAAPDGLLGLPIGDFPNLWSAGRLARDGHLPILYGTDTFTAWKHARFGHAVVRDDWIYPPMVLPLGAVVSFLPVPVGFVLWNVGTLGRWSGCCAWRVWAGRWLP
jgi:hypothetical protein